MKIYLQIMSFEYHQEDTVIRRLLLLHITEIKDDFKPVKRKFLCLCVKAIVLS